MTACPILLHLRLPSEPEREKWEGRQALLERVPKVTVYGVLCDHVLTSEVEDPWAKTERGEGATRKAQARIGWWRARSGKGEGERAGRKEGHRRHLVLESDLIRVSCPQYHHLRKQFPRDLGLTE